MRLRRCRAALAAGDAAAARSLARELAAEGHAAAWDVAARAAGEHGDDAKALLTFALAHCPEAQVPDPSPLAPSSRLL